MTHEEETALLTLSLMAAFADGAKDERERGQIRQIASSLSGAAATSLAAIYQDVLLARRSLADVAQQLQTAQTRQLAYEMAVCVCDADGAQNAAEQKFLADLRTALGLDDWSARAYAQEADALAEVPLAPTPNVPAPVAAAAAAVPVAAAARADAAPARPDPAALDKTILDYSILNGALELLPQSLATLAIIPLQMKMVYRIGRAHGYELDRAHVKELLAALGIGLASQYVEEFARKLIGGLFGKAAGGIGRAVGRQAASSAMAFASTYALGHAAKQYYGGGRTLSMEHVRETFRNLIGQAQSLRSQYAGQIEQRARTIDPKQILAMVQRQ